MDYTLLVGLISIVVLTTVQSIGNAADRQFRDVACALGGGLNDDCMAPDSGEPTVEE